MTTSFNIIVTFRTIFFIALLETDACQLIFLNKTETFYLAALKNLEQAKPKNKIELESLLDDLRELCDVLQNSTTVPDDYCPYFFDRVVCWKPVPAGTVATHECPRYIDGMHNAADGIKVSSTCTKNKTWKMYSNRKDFLDVYSNCLTTVASADPEEFYRQIIVRARSIASVGYMLSLCVLIIASCVFIFFKRLHCSRNFIHLHLFLAFLLRAFMCVLFNNMFVNDKSLESDGEIKIINQNGTVIETFAKNGSHWECKLFTSVWNYALVASYFWLLIEASYLHNVVYFFVFRETKVTYYVLFGWLAPLVVMIPWVVVRILFDDCLCWVQYFNLNYFWVQRGPIMAIFVKNFLLFVNIMRELFVKLRDSHLTETKRYRKLAKSSFVLILLLGVEYFFFNIPLLIIDTHKLSLSLAICLSVENILNSLQGVFVATVYCFVNTEVRSEIRKRWRRWLLYRNFSNSCPNGYPTNSSLLSSPGNGRNKKLSVKSHSNVETQLAESFRKPSATRRASEKPNKTTIQFVFDSAGSTVANTACSTVANTPRSSMSRISTKINNSQQKASQHLLSPTKIAKVSFSSIDESMFPDDHNLTWPSGMGAKSFIGKNDDRYV